jgi:glyoxylase-like metal-dependent hydrolase (beta-lactamase superfamily II)
MDYRVVSIGTLSRHPLWTETAGLRTPHSTCTMIRSQKRVILVDPGIPGPVLAARLNERAGLKLEAVTDVFLTNFRPAHRAGLAAFQHARWWIHETEREAVGVQLVERLQRENDPELRKFIEQDVALLRHCAAAPDKLAEHVDLFPLPGYTPGSCGLLLAIPQATVLIAGDAIATIEHMERGQVLNGCYDTKQATESMKEAIEIADWIVPGHDNVVPNLTRRLY